MAQVKVNANMMLESVSAIVMAYSDFLRWIRSSFDVSGCNWTEMPTKQRSDGARHW